MAFATGSLPVRKRIRWLVFCGAAIFLCSCFGAASPAGTGNDSRPVRVRQGEVIFQQQCVRCHNKAVGDTSSFGPPNLHGIFRRATPLSRSEAEAIIRQGKPPMPPFAGVLTTSQIDELIAYLKTLGRAAKTDANLIDSSLREFL